MKTTGIFIMLALLALSAVGQQEPQFSRNELKVNGLYALYAFPEVSYERIINTESSWGTSLAFAVDPDYSLKLAVSPYYRWFFGKKPASGFFLESSGVVFFAQQDRWYDDWSTETQTAAGGGIGLSLGCKVLSDGGWVGEVYAGLARNLISTDVFGTSLPRFGFCIGRRFGS